MVKIDIDILKCPTQSSSSDARLGPKVNLFCSDAGFWGVLGVSLTVFHRKGFFFSSKEMSNHITNQFRKKEVGVTDEKKWVLVPKNLILVF